MPSFKAEVKQFPGKGGWIYIPIPDKVADKTKRSPAWGMIPITTTIGSTTWDTSLLPMGDGTFFIAIKAAVRKKQKIELGDRLTITFDYR